MMFGLFALDATAPVDLSAAFGTALTNIQSQVNGYIGQAMPVALAIVGTIIAIGIGIKVVKKFAK